MTGQPRGRTLKICAGLVFITLLAFGLTMRNGFVNFDDHDYVVDNPRVAAGLTWSGFIWAFTYIHSANWHPLTWLSHMLDCQLYDLHPAGHHLTNVLLHAATVVGLFLVLQKMTGATWRSAFAAAIFAVHPLRVESVAWIAERKDVLSGFFFVLTVAAYVSWVEKRGWRYVIVLLLFACGLMAKPMLVTLPIILLLLDFWPLKRQEPFGKLLVEKVPLAVLSAGSCVATLLAQRDAIRSVTEFSPGFRLSNAVLSCVTYLWQIVWPVDLAPLYPFPAGGLDYRLVAAAVVAFTVIFVIVIRQRARRPWLLYGWLWYLVMLLPVVGLVQVGGQAHADRYTYLPQIGIYIAVTWWMAEWHWEPVIAGSLATILICALIFATSQQVRIWNNSELLWRTSLSRTRESEPALNNLGLVLSDKGDVDGAIDCYRRALRINPRYPQALNNLGLALFKKGDIQDAIVNYRATLKITPNDADVHFNLANALISAGKPDDALAELQAGMRLKPNYGSAENDVAIALRRLGRLDEAIAHYQRAATLLPGNESVHFNLARTFFQKGDILNTISEYQICLRLQPDDVEAQNNLAWLLATTPNPSLRDGNAALQLASHANGLTGGNNPIILSTLAAAQAETGKFADARETVQKAIALAQNIGQPELLARLGNELKSYQAEHPLHP